MGYVKASKKELYNMYKSEFDDVLGGEFDEVEIRLAVQAIVDWEDGKISETDKVWKAIEEGMQGEYTLPAMAIVFRTIMNYREENKDL